MARTGYEDPRYRELVRQLDRLAGNTGDTVNRAAGTPAGGANK